MQRTSGRNRRNAAINPLNRLEQHSEPDEQGKPQLIGDLLSDEEREFLQTEAFTAYDNDAGMTMLRIGSMNLMLHGIKHPRFFYMDTLSKSFNDEKNLDVVLMNPPFKGKMDESDINPTLPTKCKKTELLCFGRRSATTGTTARANGTPASGN